MASRHIRINFSSDLTRKVLDIFNTVQTQIRKRNRIKNNELITDVQVRPIEKPAKFYYSIEYDSNDENVFRIIFSQKREGNYKFLASTKPESGMGSSIPFPEKQKYESGFDDINTYNEKTRMLLTHGNIYDLSFVEYKDNLLYFKGNLRDILNWYYDEYDFHLTISDPSEALTKKIGDIENQHAYIRKARNLTEQTKNNQKDWRRVIGYDTYEKGKTQVDHMRSLYDCYYDGIPISIACSWANLEVISNYENLRKGKKSSITKEMLLEKAVNGGLV